MGKILLSHNKTLKLTNPVFYEIDNFENIVVAVERLENYIKSKGFVPVGPVIQYSGFKKNQYGELDLAIKMIRQSSGHIRRTEAPYNCIPLFRVKNCMYARYIGPEEKMNFAFDKIAVTAFEEDIKLKGESYTIFVDQADDNIVADVFMERADDE